MYHTHHAQQHQRVPPIPANHHLPTPTSTPNPRPPPSPPSAYAHFTACDACRKRKKRCDGLISGCAHCADKGLQCMYTSKKARSTASNAGGRVSASVSATSLDSRLQRVEAALTAAAHGSALQLPPAGSVGEGSSRFEGRVNRTPPLNPLAPKIEYYLGPASPYSYISESGVQWIEKQLGGTGRFAQMLKAAGRGAVVLDVKDLPVGGVTERTFAGGDDDEGMGSYEEKYSWDMGNGGEVVMGYIDEFYEAVNPYMPIFAERCPLPPHDTHSGSALYHALIGLGAQHMARRSPEPHLHRAAVDYHFKIAIRQLPAILCTAGTSLTCVQAVLCLVQLMLETDAQHSIFVLLGLACSLASCMGLHRNFSVLGIDPHSLFATERSLVWWTLYVLERDIVLRSGRASGLADLDIDVPLPQADRYPHLAARVKLSNIQASIVRLLYGAHPAPALAPDFASELKLWRSSTGPGPLGTRLGEGTLDDSQSPANPPWEATASAMRLRWAYIATLMSVVRTPGMRSTADVGAVARDEIQSFLQFLAIPSPVNPAPRTAAVALCGMCLCVFVELLRDRAGCECNGSEDVEVGVCTCVLGEWIDGVWRPRIGKTPETRRQRALERDIQLLKEVYTVLGDEERWRVGEGQTTTSFSKVIVGGLVGFLEEWVRKDGG